MRTACKHSGGRHRFGNLADQQVLVSTLACIASDARTANFAAPAIVASAMLCAHANNCWMRPHKSRMTRLLHPAAVQHCRARVPHAKTKAHRNRCRQSRLHHDAAINALREVDVVFVTDKGDDTTDLLRARKEVCEHYMQAKPYRIIEIQDPERDRSPAAYRSAVAAWHEKRAALYEQVIREQLSDDECGAFLVWGDPSLYDSTLRIIDQVSARRTVDFEWEIIPGITIFRRSPPPQDCPE